MKRTISILGCCASRNIFNYGHMPDLWDVRCYAFQNLPWALFEPSLEIPETEIYKAAEANFTKRMMDYDLNKKGLSEILKSGAEYLFVDICTTLFKQFRVEFNGKTTYASNAFSPGCFEKLKQVSSLNQIKFSQLSQTDISWSKIYEGLDKLAEWINKNWDITKVIFYEPKYTTKYLNKNLSVVDFSDNLLKLHNQRNVQLDEINSYFENKLNKGFILLKDVGNKISRDEGLIDDPSGLHVTPIDNIKQGCLLNKLVGIQDYDEELLYKIHIEKIIQELQKPLSLKQYLVDKNLSSNIIIFSVKDDASRYKNNIPSTYLGIDADYAYRQSYIAIINNKDRFEQKDNSFISKILNIENYNIEVNSGGYLSGKNNSSIKINGKEYSKNKRGLNLVIINKITHEIESNYVDLYEDENGNVRN